MSCKNIVKNILIVGTSENNRPLANFFAAEGFRPLEAPASSLKALRGEAGAFKCKLAEGETDAACVVVTEPVYTPPKRIGGCYVQALDEGTAERLSKVNPTTPVVILLDYPEESGEKDTEAALCCGAKLAQNKRRVVYLSRFMRTAGRGIEEAYLQARNAGVTFVKYENLEINGAEGRFEIKATDGVFDIRLETPYVISASAEISPAFAALAEKLKITDCLRNRDSFFLNPILTGRRGVYLADAPEYILTELKQFDRPRTENYAVIDSYKCAFCYTCYRVCPHGALTPNTEAAAMANLKGACEGCGLCAAVCPAAAITLNGKQPIERKLKDKIKIFCCENSAAEAMKEALPLLGDGASRFDTEAIPCGGNLSPQRLAEALAGYKAVAVAVCADEACRHFTGNKRACLLAERISKNTGARVGFMQVSHAMPGVLADKLNEFLRNLE